MRISTLSGRYTVSPESAALIARARRQYRAELMVDRVGSEVVGTVYGREVLRVAIVDPARDAEEGTRRERLLT